MATRLLICLAVLLQWSMADDQVTYTPSECLPGDKHKELACPEPEGPDYQACFQWRDSTCCTAEFTQQLADPVVTDIDGFRWNHCGPLSQSCHDYFVSMECFYRCSPNVAHWHNDPFPSALRHLPLCREFCDGWFEACASDMTCAYNWIFDWVYVNGENTCNESASCRTFSDLYGDGKGLCENLWGESFIYSNTSETDPNRQCLSVTWNVSQPNPNEVALRNIFGSRVDTVEPAPCEDDSVPYKPGECLPGDKHKELACPEPEGPDYQACFQWRDSTCCTAEFTQQLADPVVTDIDGFRWDHCGPLSQSCHDYFVSMECFYRCSPNVAHWHNDPFPSAVRHLPLCREFCDGWFEACASDMTCAYNWIFDWIYVNGENRCNESVSSCRTFSDLYGDGKGLCENLWGESFIYSNTSETDPNRQCLSVTWDLGQPNPNEVALRNIFGSLVDTMEPALCDQCEGDSVTCGASGVSVWGALVSLVTVWVAVMLL